MDYKHGFRKGFSRAIQLATICHSFAACLGNSGRIHATFLDFRKAFDKVPHGRIITKLKKINILDIFVSWISAYLSNRKQLLQINGERSQCLPVSTGVPQGSVLGPLLFLLYINDIVTVLTLMFKLDCLQMTMYCFEKSLVLMIRMN